MAYLSKFKPLWVAWVAVAVYGIAFFVFYPSTVTVTDESNYVRQGAALANGRVTVSSSDPLTGNQIHTRPSDYPIGTSFLMVPFIKLLGWRGAFLVPLISFLAVVLILSIWLLDVGRSPVYMLLFFFFPPALVMARIAMSDMPSSAIITIALWLFWKGRVCTPSRWLVAGLIAGASVMIRETNPMVFAPFVVGAHLRREKNCWYLSSAFAVGLAMRLVSSAVVFGNPLFVKRSEGFSFSAIPVNLLHGFVGVEILLFGCLIVALAYRGERRPEILASLICTFAVYSCYKYSGEQSGMLKGAILGGRYYLAIVPLSIFAASEVFQRVWNGFQSSRRNWALCFSRGIQALQLLVCLVATANAVAVHVFMDKWSSSQALMSRTIYRATSSNSVIVTNERGTRKFINELYGLRQVLDLNSVGPDYARALVQRYGSFNLVILNRRDSQFWRNMAQTNESLAGSLASGNCRSLVSDVRPDPDEELRIWRVGSGKACKFESSVGGQ